MAISSIYTAMAGLQSIDARMQTDASNLANIQTPGYAAVQAATEAAPYAGANAPGGADAVATTPNANTTQGPISHTGDPFDVAVGGDAWLEVQTPTGNALTRDGSLQITSAGILADSSGNPVLAAGGGVISVPNLNKLEIGTDGTISGVPAGQAGGKVQSYGQIGLIATPGGQLTPLTGALFKAPTGAALQPATNGSLQQGYLNGSNVDPTSTMMDLIADSRSYQLQTEMMKTQSGDASTGLNQLLGQG